MEKFLRYEWKIVTEEKKKSVTVKYIHSLIEKNVPFQILDAKTREDLTQDMIRVHLNRGRGKNDQILDPKIYGPDKPLNEVKYYSCNVCKSPTTNRFKCTGCWGECTENTDIDFIYHTL
jgi:hypothetical protein